MSKFCIMCESPGHTYLECRLIPFGTLVMGAMGLKTPETQRVNKVLTIMAALSRKNRVTPHNITFLRPNQRFVFGSNLLGEHRKGAALDAHSLFGAKIGDAEGPTGRCYAIPTKINFIERRDLLHIASSIEVFIHYASLHPELEFFVTPIGCVNAGYFPTQIAPFFEAAISKENILLPNCFWEVFKLKANRPELF